MRWHQVLLLATIVALAVLAQQQPRTATVALAAGIAVGLAIAAAWRGMLGKRLPSSAGANESPCRHCRKLIPRSEFVCPLCGAVVRETLFLGYAACVSLLFLGILLWRTGLLNVFTAAGMLVTIAVAGLTLKIGNVAIGRSRK